MVACQKRLDLLALEPIQFLKFRSGIQIRNKSPSSKSYIFQDFLLIYQEIKFTFLVRKLFVLMGFFKKWWIYSFKIKKIFRKIAWIGFHHLHLQWKFKLFVGNFTWGNKAKHCWVMSTNFLFSKVSLNNFNKKWKRQIGFCNIWSWNCKSD